MFKSDFGSVEFEGMPFSFRIPGDDVITPLYEKVDELAPEGVKVTPAHITGIASIVAPLITETPPEWEAFPQITKNRLLFEIGKYITVESLTIPPLKKK